MKKLFPLALFSVVLTSVLSSCSVNGVTKGDISGTISNAPSGKGTIRMAVLGLSFSGITNEFSQQLAVVPNDKGVYALTLPGNPKVGGYEVIAYADTNGNSQYDLSEPRTKSNGKTLVFSDGNAVGSVLGLSKGWNQVENLKVTSSSLPITGYDLSF